MDTRLLSQQHEKSRPLKVFVIIANPLCMFVGGLRITGIEPGSTIRETNCGYLSPRNNKVKTPDSDDSAGSGISSDISLHVPTTV